MQVVIRYIIKNKNTGALYHKIYNIELIESNGLSNLFDIENYVIISRDLQTGLTDKNGVKIFKGDLLDDSYNDDDGNLIEDHSEVIFNVLKGEWSIDNSFKKDKSSLTNLVRCFGSELKVIGNIYDL